MPEQYFEPIPTSAHENLRVEFAYRGAALRFTTDAGTFSREHVDPGTRLLLEALPETFAGRALDLGCGWGPLGCCMASTWPKAQVVLADINQRAVELANRNLQDNGLRGRAVVSDGLMSVEGTFDLVVTNPPIRAGKTVIYSLFAQAASRLCQEGALMLVIRTRQGADSAQRYLETLFSSVAVVERGGGYKVLRASHPLAAVRV